MIKYVIIICIVYYLLTRFVFPIFRITMTANSKMKQMQDKINEMEQKHNQTQPQKASGGKKGDYIDYEEVK